jgi:ubiquinone/menaquinone biosynthesis C-methylase UbiE
MLIKILNKFIRRFLKSDNEKKQNWEFKWQSNEWAGLYKEPENQKKVLEYWVNYRHLNEIRKKTIINDRSFILDVGCGISTVLHYLPGHRYGIDPLADKYKSIYNYPKDIDIQAAYGESIPFEKDFFDIVTCSNCIDHMKDPKQAVSEVWRVLKRGGHFILTCEVFKEDLGKRNIAHPYSMTLDKLYRLINEFQVVAHWNSSWIGLRNYIIGGPPSGQREHIFLLKKY